MTLGEKIQEITSEVRDQAGAYAAWAADAARDGADRVAERVGAAKSPIDTLAQAGQELNDLAHACVERLIVMQRRMLRDSLDDAAERLRLLSRASSAREAYGAQVEAFAQTRERIVRDADDAIGLAVHAGRGVASLAVRTYADLVREVRASDTASDEPPAGRKARARTPAAPKGAKRSARGTQRARRTVKRVRAKPRKAA